MEQMFKQNYKLGDNLDIDLSHSTTGWDSTYVSQVDSLVRMFFQLPLIVIAYWHTQENNSKQMSYLYICISVITILYFGYILF